MEIIRHLRARLRQVDRIIRSIDQEGPTDSVVEAMRALRRELKDIGHTIGALQRRLERSGSTERTPRRRRG
jgi:hypothetical protein